MNNNLRPPPAPEQRLPLLHHITRNNQVFDSVALDLPLLYPLSHPMQRSEPQDSSTANVDTECGPTEEMCLLDPGFADSDLLCNVTCSPRQGASLPRHGDKYYSKPVPLLFAPQVSSVTSVLRDRPMDLLYFHYFINHTSRSLMVHDCSDNPFRMILPQSRYRVLVYPHWRLIVRCSFAHLLVGLHFAAIGHYYSYLF